MDQAEEAVDGGADSGFGQFAATLMAGNPDISEEQLQRVWDQRPVRIELERPVEFAGKEYSELVLQPLNAGHLRQLPVNTQNLTMGDLFQVAGRQSGIPQPAIEMLVGRDLREVVTITTAFFALFQGVGGQQ